jgi:lysophospholipase L1-like esterase
MTIHLAGDSTVAPAKENEHPLTGWGEYLAEFVPDPVVNHAVGGATSESFIAEGRWHRLLDELQPADCVLIQFGHNDQKEPVELAADGGYRRRLAGFVNDVRERGATAVLVTSPERRLFEGIRLRSSHGPYPRAVRDLAGELHVPLIDLTVFTAWLYEWLGPDASRGLFVHLAPGESPAWPDGVEDNTHFRTEGARAIAAFVGRSIGALRAEGSDEAPLGAWALQP